MSAATPLDPIAFAQALIRRPSVTPADAGAMAVLWGALETLGFSCRPMPFGDIENLYARLGDRGPNLCFAGHTDVVPPGEAAAWSQPPFAAEIQDGVQGHVAYPDRAANPIPVLVRLLARLQDRVLDTGFEAFQPSNLQITSIDVGNPAGNVIPARAAARLSIRFNPTHTGAALTDWLKAESAQAQESFNGELTVETRISGEPFLTPRGEFTDMAAAAVEAVTGRVPDLSTTGGTSDARFIRALCPVIEFGLVGTTMHKADECAPVADIHTLSAIYERMIEGYFATFGGK